MKFDIPEKMKAVVLKAYDELEVVEMPVPKPGPGEVPVSYTHLVYSSIRY